METIMLNASSTTFNFKRVILIFSMVMLTTMTTYAQDIAVTDHETAIVNFLKVQNGQVFFTVSYNNAEGRKFDIAINDDSGENLYRGYFSGKNFNKVFCAPADLGKLKVTIRGYREKTLHKFEITSEARVVQETYVTAVANRQ